MKFLGDTKAETMADTKVNWLILLQWLSSPTLHWSSFPASPCSHSIHSITLGFTSPGQSNISSISYSAYSMSPSPLLRPRGPTRKCTCVHFCNSLLSPSLDLHSLGHVGTGKMVMRWESSDITDLHGALVAFSWSRRTDLKCPLTNKYFSWGVSGDFPGHSQVGDPQIHGFLFNQGKCSGTTAPHLQYSPQPLCFPHSASTMWRKLAAHSQLYTNWPTGTPCIINTLANWMAEILVCICPPPEASGQLSNWSRRDWVDQKAELKNTFT